MGTFIFLVIAFLFGVYAIYNNSGCLLTVFAVVFFLGGILALNGEGLHPALSFLIVVAITVGSVYASIALENYIPSENTPIKHVELSLSDPQVKQVVDEAVDVILDIADAYPGIKKFDPDVSYIGINCMNGLSKWYRREVSVSLVISLQIHCNLREERRKATWKDVEYLGDDWSKVGNFLYTYERYISGPSYDTYMCWIPLKHTVMFPKKSDANSQLKELVRMMAKVILEADDKASDFI